MINVQGAPAIYQSGIGVLESLPSILEKRSIKRLFIVHGIKSFQSIKDYMPNLESFISTYECYQGECSEGEVKRLKKKESSFEADVIIGIGGGKVMDLAKALGYQINKDIVLLPTLAATCASWTPLSVFYTDDGSFTHYTVFPKSTFMVLVEPRALTAAPLSYFRAGMGDSLAKWYEAAALIHSLANLPVAVQVGLQSAKLCKEILLDKGEKALHDLKKGNLSLDVIAVMDATIMLGGMVGGFADYYGRIAGAHSIHNALTHISKTHHLIHGEKVAYGILVQLALEDKLEEIKELLIFYNRIGLPKNLSDLGLALFNEDEIKTIANKALLPSESIHFMEKDYREEDVIAAISLVEKTNVEVKEREK